MNRMLLEGLSPDVRQEDRIAAIANLPPRFNWSDTEDPEVTRRFQLLAVSYGLDETASRDDIYAAWRRGWRDEVSAGAKSALIGAVPGTLLLLVWTNWLTIAVAIIVFIPIFLFFMYAEMSAFGQINDEVYRLVPEIATLAKRDRSRSK